MHPQVWDMFWQLKALMMIESKWWKIVNFAWKKLKHSNCSLLPSALAKYLMLQLSCWKHSQKATLNFFFKSRFPVKPSKYILHMIIEYIVETNSVCVWTFSIFFYEHISHIFLFLLIRFFQKIFIAFSPKNWLPLHLLTI